MSRLIEKLNIIILMGGPSAEHEVSLATGGKILNALDKNKYNLKPITITKDGKWMLPPAEIKLLDYIEKRNKKDIVLLENEEVVDRLKGEKSVDVAIIAMHGTYGEDGTIQGLLELANIPYTGSDVMTSALAINKDMTKRTLRSEGILMPGHIILEKDYSAEDFKRINLPFIVKPNKQGSSVGITIVKNKKQISSALKKAFQFDSKIMLEEYLDGQEITAAVLGNKNLIALPLIEIRPKISDYFDYRAKYEIGGSEEICPAPISKALTKKIQDIALKVHKILECRGVTRSDFILKDGKPYFLEINTIPGMTETSLVPQAAAKAGITFSKLMDKLVELALEQKNAS
jgi:D-alanine-D-alanine ligase